MNDEAPKSRHRMARFPRAREHRVSVGWEVADLAAKLPGGKPSVSSIYRLEDGHAIRYISVIRVFDALNAAHKDKLVRSIEIVDI